MKIILKPKSSNLDEYIKRGASAFLFGFNDLSLEGSGIISFEELEKITKIYKTKEIFVRLDLNYFNKDLPFLLDMLKKLEKLNIQGVLFYDLAIINLVKENNLNLNLIWNQNYFVTNSKSINFYDSLGIKGAVLTSEITTEEMKEIANKVKIPLFVNLFGYQLMAVSKRKFITHYLEAVSEEKEDEDYLFFEDENKYKIKESNKGSIMLSNNILNGIVKVKELKGAGLKYLIIDSFEIEERTILDIITYYKEAIITDDEKELVNLESKIKELLPNTFIGFLDKKTIYQVKR